MRVSRLGYTAVRSTVALWSVWVLVGTFHVTGYARQDRSVAEGVYSDSQATRGEGTYRTECVTCHGDGLEGQVGPSLAGEAFLAVWSGRPLMDLVDKIHATMPPEAPEPLSRPQAIDLAAYILQTGSFVAGQADLSDATLPQIVLPTVSTPATAAAQGAFQAPAANLAQLMRSIAFPNSNVIFNVQVRAPDAG